MEELAALWPLLNAEGQKLLSDMARALVGTRQDTRPDMLTVAQAAQEYGVSEWSINAAMRGHRLDYRVPNGQTRPRYVRRADFEEWLYGSAS